MNFLINDLYSVYVGPFQEDGDFVFGCSVRMFIDKKFYYVKNIPVGSSSCLSFFREMNRYYKDQKVTGSADCLEVLLRHMEAYKNNLYGFYLARVENKSLCGELERKYIRLFDKELLSYLNGLTRGDLLDVIKRLDYILIDNDPSIYLKSNDFYSEALELNHFLKRFEVI